jgi:hypothetical protein
MAMSRQTIVILKIIYHLLKLSIFFFVGYIFGFLFILEAQAAEKAPKPFNDSNIERKLKDGSTQKFDGNKYKIVPRVKKAVKKEEPKKEQKLNGSSI